MSKYTSEIFGILKLIVKSQFCLTFKSARMQTYTMHITYTLYRLATSLASLYKINFKSLQKLI